MKNTLLLLLAVQLLFSSCSKSKEDSVLVSETATISLSKFPCGPNCTADAWLLVTDHAQSYEPLNLPESFKVSQLAVMVTIRKTGISSNAFDGSNVEKVEVIKIIQR